jgi:desulfoferrodoxin (superoxide reductase-like protein)
MWVEDQEGIVVFYVNSSLLSPPRISFSIPPNATKLTPFEHCNLHGLWQGPKYDVQREQIVASLVAATQNTNGTSIAAYGPLSYWPYQGGGGKHEPFLRLFGNDSSSVEVGVRGNTGSMVELHPQNVAHHASFLCDPLIASRSSDNTASHTRIAIAQRHHAAAIHSGSIAAA